MGLLFPTDYGFFMPPEWGRHARTLMEWPVREALWPEPFDEILPSYASVVRAIAQFEPVTLIVRPDLLDEAARLCGENIDLLPLIHNDSWMRDNGPTFVINAEGDVAGIDWIFNGWGNKFSAELDNQVASKVLEHLGMPRFAAPLIMEGGSFHVDGEGTLITTEECLLNKNRNPKMNRFEIEENLRRYLGVQKIIWLKRGWVGDDTDGHVDNVACFARPGVILTQICSDPKDDNYDISQENLAILRENTDAHGRTFEIITMEQPPASHYGEMPLTQSYLNFYFVNGGIILPLFGGGTTPTDRAAVETLARVFPERKIQPIDGGIVARGGGNVHCLTQQVPQGRPAKLLLK